MMRLPVSFLLLASTALACPCGLFSTNLISSFFTHNNVVVATVDSGPFPTGTGGTNNGYGVTLNDVYKRDVNCNFPPGYTYLVETPIASASCGVQGINVGDVWVFHGDLNSDILTVDNCSATKLFSSLTFIETILYFILDFLDSLFGPASPPCPF